MKRIVLAAVIVSLVTVGAYPATKAKTKTAKTPTAAAQSAPKVPLTALFPAPAAQPVVSTGGMITMDAPNHEVVMARINDDSTRSHACVNTEAAARAFVAGPKSGTAPVKQEH
jgi:hypothetical protein